MGRNDYVGVLHAQYSNFEPQISLGYCSMSYIAVKFLLEISVFPMARPLHGSVFSVHGTEWPSHKESDVSDTLAG